MKPHLHLGVSRPFQPLQIFGALSVLDNVIVGAAMGLVTLWAWRTTPR